MKNVTNALIAIGILAAIYSIVEKYVGTPTINLGAIEIDAISGIITACAILLVGISLKLWDK